MSSYSHASSISAVPEPRPLHCRVIKLSPLGFFRGFQSPGEIKRREVSWTLMKSWTLICGSRRDQEEGGGAGPSREPWRDQEQGGGAGLGKLDNPLLQLFLTSCFTDMVFVTLLRTAAETAISEGSTQVASRWRSPHLLNIAVLEVVVGLFGLWGVGVWVGVGVRGGGRGWGEGGDEEKKILPPS